jgi:DNA-directed RNA polymerase specialized sigma24 family protein
VERERALAGLPITYQRILAWVDEGLSVQEIAARLGIEPAAVSPMIRLGEAKLARLAAALGDAGIDGDLEP